MQSWGTRSRFTERDTEMEPSKSGVVGLICAALGRPRDQDVTDLAALRMGVRVDHEGRMERDYHTAGGVDGIARASGSQSKNAVLSNRYYLSGADFLVGIESQNVALLQEVEAGLRNPRWQVSLGRKSFVPSVPVHMPFTGGLRSSGLENALRDEPWPLEPAAWSLAASQGPQRLRLVIETNSDNLDGETRMDQPLGAAFQDRTFGPRTITQSFHEKERGDHVPLEANL